MIKKLYTADDDDDDGGSDKKAKKLDRDSINESRMMDKSVAGESDMFINQQTQGEGEDKQDILVDEISSRKTFSYSTGRWYFLRRMSSPFCCLCPCLKPKNKREDILFKDAKQKLYEEIDLLEIVKKLRVNQFASDVVLKPRQRDLVNFFQDYKLNGEKEPETITYDDDSNMAGVVPDNRKTANLGGLGQAH